MESFRGEAKGGDRPSPFSLIALCDLSWNEMIHHFSEEFGRKHVEVTNGWERGGSLRGRGLSGFEWSVHVF